MQLITRENPATVVLVGREMSQMAQGENLKIKVAGVETLNTEVPHGKVWVVDISVTIKETAA